MSRVLCKCTTFLKHRSFISFQYLCVCLHVSVRFSKLVVLTKNVECLFICNIVRNYHFNRKKIQALITNNIESFALVCSQTKGPAMKRLFHKESKYQNSIFFLLEILCQLKYLTITFARQQNISRLLTCFNCVLCLTYCDRHGDGAGCVRSHSPGGGAH